MVPVVGVGKHFFVVGLCGAWFLKVIFNLTFGVGHWVVKVLVGIINI